MSGALEGIRVLDLSQGAAGPTCAMLLGDLGAEVIKVEPPGGEWGRGLGPPFVGDVAAAYLGMNRNKRSIVIDLKRPGGSDLVLRLAGSCDVAIESFRPGVADRLGVGYGAMSSRNPRLVYAAISAFGQVGPWRDLPGVDGIVQAMSGLMSVTGTSDGPPMKVGVPAADMVGGFLAVQAILAGLFVRERTGRGQRADVSLLDGLLAFQVVPLSMFSVSGEAPVRQGSAAPYAAPNEAFPTRDGYVMVAAYTPERWERLCSVLGRPELASDPRFDTNEKRVRDRAALREVLEPSFGMRTTSEWLEILGAADILCGPLLTYPELLAQAHVEASGVLVSERYGEEVELRSASNPVRLSSNPSPQGRPAPHTPGQHSEQVLAELGLGAEEIDGLFGSGIVHGLRRTDVAAVDSA